MAISPPREISSDELSRYLDKYPTFCAWFEANKVVDERFNCWLWKGPTNSDGYGVLYVACEKWFVHRLAYELWKGSTSGVKIDHFCRTPSCFNPQHLVQGVKKFQRFSKLTCPHGKDSRELCEVCKRRKRTSRMKRLASARLRRGAQE